MNAGKWKGRIEGMLSDKHVITYARIVQELFESREEYSIWEVMN